MKRLYLPLILLTAGVAALAGGKKEKHPLMAAEQVVWAGLDYSMVRMIGPGDFTDPQAIFPGFLESWNDLFLRERIVKVEKALKKKVVMDIGGVTARNKKATADQIKQTAGADDAVAQTHITPGDIADAVRSYELENTTGLGLVFIVDRMSKSEKKSAIYVVFFDVSSRQVISADRFVKPAAGFGFRNYWFGPVKRVDEELKEYR